MAPEHSELFEKLCSQKDVVVVSGGSLAQVREQITPRFDGKYYVLAQSGNEAIDKSGNTLWRESLSELQVRAIEEFIELLRHDFPEMKQGSDFVDNRGAQITASMIGAHADIERKYAFDPDERKRRAALANHTSEVTALAKIGIAIEPAGTTSFNFILAGKHKGHNIARFIEKMSWNREDCVYVGDALFSGGNDASVIGIIPTHPIKDPGDCFDYVKQELLI